MYISSLRIKIITLSRVLSYNNFKCTENISIVKSRYNETLKIAKTKRSITVRRLQKLTNVNSINNNSYNSISIQRRYYNNVQWTLPRIENPSYYYIRVYRIYGFNSVYVFLGFYMKKRNGITVFYSYTYSKNIVFINRVNRIDLKKKEIFFLKVTSTV